MKPLQPVNPGTRVVLGVSFFILFFALWAAVTFGGLVSKTFLAYPWTMVKSGYDLLVNTDRLGAAEVLEVTLVALLGASRSKQVQMSGSA